MPFYWELISPERTKSIEKPTRGKCGARTRKGQPCQAKAVQGKKRCRMHGGLSTGPHTSKGKARALANLVQFRQFKVRLKWRTSGTRPWILGLSQ